MTPVLPYWRLSAFYLFYFASTGAFVPYWSLYLKDWGFSAVHIGELMAITMATKIIAPNVWGWLSDHLGLRMPIIRGAVLVAVLAFGGVLFVQGYWGMALVLAVFSFFWHAALPQFEVITLRHLGGDTHRYSHIRLWGSIGFIVSVSALAPLFDHQGIGLLPWVMLLLLGLIGFTTLRVSERRVEAHLQPAASLWAVVRTPSVMALLLACLLLQGSHGPYYTFFSIYLEDHGYSRTLVGSLWALGVIAEVVIFLLIHRWLPRYGAAFLLLGATAVTTVRWVLLALFVDVLPVVLLAQLMHAASYGVYHAAAIELIHQLFPGRLQGRGQALYSSMSFGVGGALGSLASGYVWEQAGPAWTFGFGALVAGASVAVAWVLLREREGRPPRVILN